jgi:hypothetical protein
MPFNEEEIHEVIDQMEKNKAATPDGIPVKFYQQYWSIIKRDIIKMFNDFHEHKINLERSNYGIVTLIPKSDAAEVIQKYIPICLLGFVQFFYQSHDCQDL